MYKITGNIFIGLTESPLLVLPFINELTSSEIFSMMVCGFGSIAGTVLGALLGFGVSKNMTIKIIYT